MLALAGTVLLAAPASAHTPAWSVTCNSVSVHLKQYNARVTNSVTLSVVGGEGVLADNADFGSTFTYDEPLPDHDAPLQLHLVVKAGDSTKRNNYDVDEVKTSPVCEGHTTTPPPPTTTPPTTATTTATTAPPTTTPETTPATTSGAPTTATGETSSAAVAATETSSAAGGLAETGGSSSTPLIAGIAAAVVAGGGGLVFLSRRRGSSAHR